MEDKYKIANFRRACTILYKYKASMSQEQLEKESKDLNSNYHKLLVNVDKCIPDYLEATLNKQVNDYYNPEPERSM